LFLRDVALEVIGFLLVVLVGLAAATTFPTMVLPSPP